MIYLGYNVLDVRNFVDLGGESPLSQRWIADVYQFDKTHPLARFFRKTYPEGRIDLKLQFNALQDFATVRDFFLARVGGLQRFWLIYPFYFLDLTQDLVGGDAAISIRSVNYNAEFIGSTGTFRHLFITDGETINCRKVASAVDGDDEDTLTLDASLTLPATFRDSVQLLLLFFVTFARDELTSQWPELVHHAEVDVAFQELMSDYP